MSRKNRTTAPPFPSWHGLPRELPEQLYHVSAFARALAVELFRCSDHGYQGRVTIRGPRWDVSLCRTLQVEGPERRNVCGALKQLKGAGILLVHDDCVTICVGQSLDGLPAQVSGDAPVGSQSVSTRSPLGPQSDSTRVPLEVKCAESLKVDPTNRQTEETEESERRARARESSARFEKPPLPAPPPELPAPVPEPSGWLRVWRLYEQSINREGMLGSPGRFRDALTGVAAAAEVEAGGSEGVDFDKAVQRLLSAWLADRWVQEKRPTIDNLAKNLHRFARPKSVVKIVPAIVDPRDKEWTDEELLAIESWQESSLDLDTKMRRWKLQARAERLAGGAS